MTSRSSGGTSLPSGVTESLSDRLGPPLRMGASDLTLAARGAPPFSASTTPPPPSSLERRRASATASKASAASFGHTPPGLTPQLQPLSPPPPGGVPSPPTTLEDRLCEGELKMCETTSIALVKQEKVVPPPVGPIIPLWRSLGWWGGGAFWKVFPSRRWGRALWKKQPEEEEEEEDGTGG